MSAASLVQEPGSLEGKSRMSFHHPEKGRAASSSPLRNGETGAVEQLPRPGLTGESMYRRRYTQGKGTLDRRMSFICNMKIPLIIVGILYFLLLWFETTSVNSKSANGGSLFSHLFLIFILEE